jgi:hypothetical protein
MVSLARSIRMCFEAQRPFFLFFRSVLKASPLLSVNIPKLASLSGPILKLAPPLSSYPEAPTSRFIWQACSLLSYPLLHIVPHFPIHASVRDQHTELFNVGKIAHLHRILHHSHVLCT